MTDGLRLFGLELGGKSVLLKPNLVEYIPGAEVNTNPLLVGAAAGAFLALGAKIVVVAEGPGHRRDTYLVLAQSSFESQLRDRKLNFVVSRCGLDRLNHEFLPPAKPEAAGAKRFFRKALNSPSNSLPRVIHVDKNPAYPAAAEALKEEGVLPVVFGSVNASTGIMWWSKTIAR